jgi:signal transduction histidine kinase
MVSLESSKLCSSLSSSEQQALSKVAQIKTFSQDSPIFCEGDKGDGIYVVRKGEVQITASLNRGEPRKLSRIGPGDFFGELAILDSEPRSASATAETETEVYFIPQFELVRLLEEAPKFAISLVREVSRRVREFNRQYIQDVLQAERLAIVGEFARSIVHDIRNPLTVIGLAAEMIGGETSSPEARRTAAKRIRQQVDRLGNMIKELLEFTRVSQSSLALAPADFAAYMVQLLEELRCDLQSSSVELTYENSPPSVTLLMEPERLTHVFFNLANNAVDAMPKGGKIFFRFAVQEGKALLIEIEDTGPGLPPEIASELFTPFATFGKPRGTGLGLSICKKIIEDHRGQIRVRTELGRGAIFSITLPFSV